MKVKFLIFTLLTTLTLFCFVSCSDEDGNWDSMKWSSEVRTSKDGTVDVPQSGSTYTYTCKNYNGFWLTRTNEKINGEEKQFYANEDSNTWNSVSGVWSTAKVENNVLTVTISSNDTGTSRELIVSVTAGDIFDGFTFKQQ